MGAIDFVKRHPIGVGVAAVVGVGIVILVSSSGGGSDTAVMTSGGDTSALASLQAQLQAATAQVNAQLEAKREDNATAIKLAELQGQQQANYNEIAGNVALTQLDYTREVTLQQTSLAATLQQAAIDAQKYLADRQLSSTETLTAQANVAAQKQAELFYNLHLSDNAAQTQQLQNQAAWSYTSNAAYLDTIRALAHV